MEKLYRKEWDESYSRGENNILYPKEEVVKFLNRGILIPAKVTGENSLENVDLGIIKGNFIKHYPKGSNVKLTTFFSVLNTLDTSGLLNLQISTGILTTSVDPSSNVISIINGITSPPMFLNFIL